jgi:hypothetical protein
MTHDIAHADRAALEVAHGALLERLHKRSDDFDATRRLRAVSAALQRLPQESEYTWV